MNDHQTLTGRVLDVMSPTEVIIDIGKADGVQTGMKFEILDEDQQIRLKGQPIAIIRRVKIRVRARHVFRRFTICETYQKSVMGLGLGLRAALAESAGLTGSTERQSLRKEDLPYRRLSLQESFLDRGDRAVPLEGEEGPDVVVEDLSEDSEGNNEDQEEVSGAPDDLASPQTQADEIRIVDPDALEEYANGSSE